MKLTECVGKRLLIKTRSWTNEVVEASILEASASGCVLVRSRNGAEGWFDAASAGNCIVIDELPVPPAETQHGEGEKPVDVPPYDVRTHVEWALRMVTQSATPEAVDWKTFLRQLLKMLPPSEACREGEGKP